MITSRIEKYIADFNLLEEENPTKSLFDSDVVSKKTLINYSSDKKYRKYINEFWTSKQKQGSSLHQISYRACFKAQLPNFFIKLLTKEKDTVYDPFSGRGTTVIEAGLLSRNVIANDINPLSKIFSGPRFFVPKIDDVEKRLADISIDYKKKADIDLSMFYHPKTESEIVSLKKYFSSKKLDDLDRWIKMVATNRLTGHSAGFFSVYTLPPNQAVSQESQIKINKKREQKPEYKEIKNIILRKTKSLIKNVDENQKRMLQKVGQNALFFSKDARKTGGIKSESIQLTVTSPPFLDVVQYSKDNWLRCWFNDIDDRKISKKMTVIRNLEKWCDVMQEVFNELHRITRSGGWVAFEVGEVRNGKIKLDEHVLPIGLKAGFKCFGTVINSQVFTKTSNIWGVKNNSLGTNTNRIVLFYKK